MGGVFGVGRSDVVVIVEEALRGIGVRVDHDGGVLNFHGLLADDGLRGQGNGDGE